jgi:hypothetical protein
VVFAADATNARAELGASHCGAEARRSRAVFRGLVGRFWGICTFILSFMALSSLFADIFASRRRQSNLDQLSPFVNGTFTWLLVAEHH